MVNFDVTDDVIIKNSIVFILTYKGTILLSFIKIGYDLVELYSVYISSERNFTGNDVTDDVIIKN